ncbi:hypothetical protein D9M71_772580 [compost metagenome]
MPQVGNLARCFRANVPELKLADLFSQGFVLVLERLRNGGFPGIVEAQPQHR